MVQSKLPSRNSTKEVDNATCQYSYMMRLSQPDVPCPDNLTIQFMLQYHNLFMSAYRQNEEMCSRRRYPTSVNTKMVRIHLVSFSYNFAIYVAMIICVHVHAFIVNIAIAISLL